MKVPFKHPRMYLLRLKSEVNERKEEDWKSFIVGKRKLLRVKPTKKESGREGYFELKHLRSNLKLDGKRI